MTRLAAERDLRWNRVRSSMEKSGIDCLIIVGNTGLNLYRLADLFYLTGLQREGVLIFPREGEPTLFSFGGSHDPDAWVTDHVNGYPRFAYMAVDALTRKGLGASTIGVLLSGYEGDLNFPLNIYRKISATHPSARIVDAAPILAEARRTKTDYEIECFRRGCEVGQNAIASVAEIARPGVDDLEVKIALMSALFRGGCASHTLLLFHSGAHSVHGAMGGALPAPKGRRLGSGDIINVEFDAMYEGYCAQFNQPFFLGQMHDAWEEIASIGQATFEVGVENLRPGVTARELQNAMREAVKSRGHQALGPMFHGLGSSFENPVAQTSLGTSFDTDLETVFEPGMVVELEPHVVAMDFKRGASFGCPVLVTADGCELLAKGWKPMPVRIEA